MHMEKKLFGTTPDGQVVEAYTLRAGNLSATVLTLGGILQTLCVDGCDIVAGYDTVEGYLNSDGYMGALIGRYANRIRGGTFTMNNRVFTLNANEKGINHLHGGNVGFDKRIWTAVPAMMQGGEGLVLTLVSPDGEEKYPGTARVRVTYLLSPGCLAIHYEAVADRDTPFNMTNHSYFNLNGYDSGDIYDHTLQLYADRYCEVDADLIPVNIAPVDQTPFDFRRPKRLGDDIASAHPQIVRGSGYDHNYYLNQEESMKWEHYTLYRAAYLSAKKHTMRVYTNLPCIQLYTANFMGGPIPLKGGAPKCNQHAVCLETQFAPDGPNRGESILKAGESWDYTTLFALD